MTVKADPWLTAVLHRLALRPDALLTLALDPDDLLLTEPFLMALREMGVGLLTLDLRRPFPFRHTYEAEYRSRWDAGESPRLLVRVPSTDPNDFPYDLLDRVGGRGAVRGLSLVGFFPHLAYPVLRDLATHDPPMIARLHSHYQAHPPDRRLGPKQTCWYLLERIYDVSSHEIRAPADLVRYLLRRHRQEHHPPPSLDAVLLEWWRQEPTLASLPLEELLQRPPALYRCLEAAWPDYLAGQELPVQQEQATYEAALASVFEDRDVQAYVDTLFLEGRLRPARLREPAPVYGWVKAGTAFDEADYRAGRLRRLLDHLEESLPGERDDYRSWLSFAPRWAEAVRLRGQVVLASEESKRFDVFHDYVEDRFASWLESRYAALATMPPVPVPVMGHQVVEALAYRLREGEIGRAALLVLDGLAWDQWLVLQEALELEPLEESGLFAWVPTLTPVARQSLFAGQPPYAFPDTWKRTDADERRWRVAWEGQGLSSQAVAYVRDPRDVELKTVLGDRRVQVLGLVHTRVDRMVHGAQLGTVGLHQQIRQWAEGGELAGLLDRVREAGFACWLTSDHGNVEASGVGVPKEGVLVETRGQRVRIYDNEDFLQRAHTQVPQALTWTPDGLPGELCLLLAPGRGAFMRPDEVAVCHGGISLEEVVVPFVRLF
jgi:hypothetical protein